MIERMVLRRSPFVAAGVAFGLACMVGCEPAQPSADGAASEASLAVIYVGTVEATDIRVGLVVESGNAALFFCGGARTLSSTRWFRGASEPQRLSLTATTGATANGAMTSASASGTVRLASNGPELKWSASRVAAGSPAGLYEYQALDGLGGVVVTDADSAQGAFVPKSLAAPVSQIIVFNPIVPTDERFKVSVDAREIFVTRVHPR